MKNRLFFLIHLVAFLMAPGPAIASELIITEDEDIIRVTLHGNPVLEYVKTPKPVPNGLSDVYRRSGYIHPVYSPSGQEITGDFPADHAHQHALFLAWTKAEFDGEEVDFWNQHLNTGVIEHRSVEGIERRDDKVSFTVKHAFLTGPGDKRTEALIETWIVTVYLTPEDTFLFDIDSIQECASDIPFHNKEYHYGGMSLRGNYQWLKENGDKSISKGDLEFLTSEGKDRWDGNHTRPDWVSMSGEIDGKAVSITVMGSPDNFRAPQPVRIHPNKPYFCFAPMVLGSFTIEPGQKYISRYRYLVRSESADPDLIKKYWQEYTNRNTPQ